MRIRTIFLALIPIGLVLLIVAAAIELYSNPSVSAQSQSGPISHLTQKIVRVNGPSTGFSAIKPHLHPANSNEPTYTAADVQKFVLAGGSPAGPLVPGAHITFTKILFVTAGQAALLPLGDETGYPSNASICYVLIHGPFYPEGKHEDDPHQLKPVQYTILIFDGVTGNYLYWGIPSSDINWSTVFKD